MCHVDEGGAGMRGGGHATVELVAGVEVKEAARSVLVDSLAHAHHSPTVEAQLVEIESI